MRHRPMRAMRLPAAPTRASKALPRALGQGPARGLLVGLLAGLVGVLAGCGSAPDTIGPTGVDQLVIPTPTPDPADFVAGVDNRYLPLAAGAQWSYLVSGDETVRRAAVAVSGSPRVIADVPTTQVVTVLSDGRGRTVERRTSWFAQDREGNVWQFGGATFARSSGRPPQRWFAGVAGAEAGLAMPATPRVGDGYLAGRAAGVVEDRVQVASVTDTESGAGATFADVVVRTRTTSGLDPEVVVQRWYAPDVGLVRELSESGVEWTLLPVEP